MIIVGFDPGATIGWAAVEWTNGRARWIEGGSTRDMEVAAGKIRIDVAIEVPAGPWVAPERAAALLHCAFVAGELAGRAKALGSRVRCYTASDVRTVLCARATATDGQVHDALRRWIVDLPARTNAHVRDAAAVVLVAALGRKP